MKIRTTLDWKSLRFQLASKGFNVEHLEIIKDMLEQHQQEIYNELAKGNISLGYLKR